MSRQKGKVLKQLNDFFFLIVSLHSSYSWFQGARGPLRVRWGSFINPLMRSSKYFLLVY